jgi:hypothetical protein
MKKINAHLVSLGAQPTPERLYPWTLKTPLGELGINVDSFTREWRDPGTIFCRFENPALALLRFPHEVNRYTGKWNFHFGEGCTVASACAVFFADLALTRDMKAIALAVAQWSNQAQTTSPKETP